MQYRTSFSIHLIAAVLLAFVFSNMLAGCLSIGESKSKMQEISLTPGQVVPIAKAVVVCVEEVDVKTGQKTAKNVLVPAGYLLGRAPNPKADTEQIEDETGAPAKLLAERK